ncbi:Uncharacterised protein [Mycobacteroides abscessus subsp. abscessus]|nr:Uncharacterised protein [Mycobacteroides abscessus subsp. abscessus]
MTSSSMSWLIRRTSSSRCATVMTSRSVTKSSISAVDSDEVTSSSRVL